MDQNFIHLKSNVRKLALKFFQSHFVWNNVKLNVLETFTFECLNSWEHFSTKKFNFSYANNGFERLPIINRMSNKITVTWLRSKMFFLYEIIELSYFPLSWPDRISIWYNFLYFHKLPFVLWGNIKYNKIFDQHLVIIVFSFLHWDSQWRLDYYEMYLSKNVF